MHRRFELSLHLIEGPVAALLERPLTEPELDLVGRQCNALARQLGQLGLTVALELIRDVRTAALGEDDDPVPAFAAARALEELRTTLADTEAGLAATAATDRSAVLVGTPTNELDAIALALAFRGLGLLIDDPQADPVDTSVVLVAIPSESAVDAGTILRGVRDRYPTSQVHGIATDGPETVDVEAQRELTSLPDPHDPQVAAEQILTALAHAERPPIAVFISHEDQQRTLPHHTIETEHHSSDTEMESITAAARSSNAAVLVLDRVEHQRAVEIATRMRTDPANADIRVLVVPTMRTRPTQRIELLRAGADSVANTNVSSDELVACILSTTRRKHRTESIDTALDQGTSLVWSSMQVLGERLINRYGRTGQRVSVARITLDEHSPNSLMDEAIGPLAAEFRREDMTGRFNEREAVVLLPGLPRFVAVKRFASLVDRVGLGQENVRIGIAEFPSDGRTMETLLDAAGGTILRTMRSSGPRIAASDWEASSGDRADVLIVEPDAAHRAVMRTVIEERGLRVSEASNGIQALSLLVGGDRKPLPRVILLEFDLDGIDGTRLLRQLRSHGLLGRFEVLMLASRNDEFELRKAFELGAIDAIRKPFIPLVLGNRVAHLARGIESS